MRLQRLPYPSGHFRIGLEGLPRRLHLRLRSSTVTRLLIWCHPFSEEINSAMVNSIATAETDPSRETEIHAITFGATRTHATLNLPLREDQLSVMSGDLVEQRRM